MAAGENAAKERKRTGPGFRPGIVALCLAAVVAAAVIKSSPSAESWVYCTLGLRGEPKLRDSQVSPAVDPDSRAFTELETVEGQS